MTSPKPTALAVLALAGATVIGLSGCADQPPGAIPAADASAPSNPITSPASSRSPSTGTTPVASQTSSSTTVTSSTPSASVTSTPSLSTSASPTPTPSQKPSVAAMMKAGAKGEQVRELQHRLQQLAWFEGKITGTYGETTTAAVRGFQAKRDLPTTGEVDKATWHSLTERTKQPTHDQMHNILRPGPALLKQGSKGAEVQELQARLKQIDWFSGKVTPNYGPETAKAVKDFQERRGIPATGEVDQRTKERLLAMTRKPTKEEINNLPPKVSAPRLDPRCMTGRAICISKDAQKLSWVVDGQVKQVMSVRFGSELTPTREGTFRVGWKSRDHVSTLYHTKMPFAMFFSGGQAIHYSADFAARGYNGASHGCVNVRNYDGIASLFEQVHEGDKVIVHR